MATKKGKQSLFEGVGSTVKIGNFKTDDPEGATVQFNDGGPFGGRRYFKQGNNVYGEFKSATVTFQNNISSGQATYENKAAQEVVHTLRVTTTTEPIDTHPNFGSQIGGNSEKPLHQAEYDEDGAFRKFPLKYLENQGEMKPDTALNAKGDQFNFGDQNRYAGVSSYLNASAIWTRSFSSENSPTLAGIGRISTPSGDAPTPEGRTWLYSGFSATFTSPSLNDRSSQQVQGRITQEWRLSGRKGWDTDIYGTSGAEGGDPEGNNAGNLRNNIRLRGAKL